MARMISNHRILVAIVAAFISLPITASSEENVLDKLLRIPGNLLWQGFTQSEFVVDTDKEVKLPTDKFGFGDLSRDGRLFLATLCKSGCKPGNENRQDVIGTYQLETKEWTEYTEAQNVQALSLSPDHTKIAYVNQQGLHLVEIGNKNDSILVPDVSRAQPSWSPDNNKIAFQVDLPTPTNSGRHGAEIFVIDLLNKKTGKISADGQDPAWSPSGEWIAFFDTSGAPGGEKCKLIRPDGRDEHVLLEAPKSYWGERGFFGVKGDFWLKPVWSPDSKKLLLNVYWDWETLKTDIFEFEVGNQNKPVRKIHYGFPILGWAAIKN